MDAWKIDRLGFELHGVTHYVCKVGAPEIATAVWASVSGRHSMLGDRMITPLTNGTAPLAGSSPPPPPLLPPLYWHCKCRSIQNWIDFFFSW
ncbi:hypothetical protein PAHAL_3G265600 [Panicum hallii]|uniref:Uncharacterized protein n=1 Tax=Panicum hallii TaxID=206008 RepID=A0A2T8KJL4_9POAL|nr:hypothetical protein PAHAL_3G265600 [Panicum hallii]